MSKGTRNYDRCQVKTVTHTTYYYRPGARVGHTQRPKDIDTTAYTLAYGSSLQCPKSPKGEISSSSASTDKTEASGELRQVAAKIACQSCQFSRLSPSEVDLTLAEEAEAKARRLRAENELLRAEKEHEYIMRLGHEALQELEGRPIPE